VCVRERACVRDRDKGLAEHKDITDRERKSSLAPIRMRAVILEVSRLWQIDLRASDIDG